MSQPDEPDGIQRKPGSERLPEPSIPWDIKLGARDDSEYAGLTPYPTSGLPELPPEKSAIVEVVAGLMLGSVVGAFLGLTRHDAMALPFCGMAVFIGGFFGWMTAVFTGKAGKISAWNMLTALLRVLFVASFSFCLGPWGIILWAVRDSKKYEEGR